MSDVAKEMTRKPERRLASDVGIVIGLIVVVLFFLGTGFISYLNTRTLLEDNKLVIHTHDVISTLDDILSISKDAEPGQRGFLLTGNDSYLGPYNTATAQVKERIDALEDLVRDNPNQAPRVKVLRAHVQNKLDELANTIELRRTKGMEAALALVETDMGKAEMDLIRQTVNQMDQEEERLRERRLAEMQDAYKTAVTGGILTGTLGAVLSFFVALLVLRASALRRRQEWLQTGQVGFGMASGGDQRLELLGENALRFLTDYVDAQAGAFFAKDGAGFRRIAAFGTPADAPGLERFDAGDGLLGEAVKSGKPVLVRDVPDNYITIGSALGRAKPRYLVIAPTESDGVINGVLELGFFHPVPNHTLELMDRVSEIASIAIRSAIYRANLQDFLEETQRQAEELQAQSEELRVANEELEEQSRALKESQARLEQQQVELEQTNSQLEEQAQQLEVQRDDIAQAKELVDMKARELERASRYKSDFLANMSHELRTPLNSSLILAKLLADNPGKNLTAEQVKYAQTIQSSGNDLLALINDILDLSKIEAGHMELHPETVPFSRLVNDLTRLFQPMAQQKGLAFKAQVDPACGEDFETDRQRVEQVLKNLLSNALKFTEQGSVELKVSRAKDGRVALAVTDTGIGISPEQQQAIFEAFRQADSTISRKYGGTGLGLSISRELARLLGGEIRLESEEGEGSTFTLLLPQTYAGPEEQFAPEMSVSVSAPPKPEASKDDAAPPRAAPPRAREKRRWIEDDRDKLTANSRIILVVEDDETFARILYQLAHELDFQCLIASTAEDALVTAKQFLPSAVVLDVGLPDHSGLSVLDRLKRDARTRHIPVHVISGGDYAQKAMSLGAVGYMLKPVKREEIVDVLEKLEDRLEHRPRRVLIVEDDEVQQESMIKLLGSVAVDAVAVGTAAECLEQLKSSTFDCMVLDLSLPDASGYALLETLSREDTYAFPPVIVYTGRELSADEEQMLRRYSKSIIIKGAKSPERLLDEVTLFLHQVVSDLPAEQQRMIEAARNRDSVLEGRRILVVEDDVRNVYALTNILEPGGAVVQIARNGREALEALEKSKGGDAIDLVLMDVMMPEMDGMTATREIRKRPEWKKLPVIMLTAKAMKDDQERCLEAGANDYMAKPLDVEKLLSLVRVWMPR